jgi:hypothetical protein
MSHTCTVRWTDSSDCWPPPIGLRLFVLAVGTVPKRISQTTSVAASASVITSNVKYRYPLYSAINTRLSSQHHLTREVVRTCMHSTKGSHISLKRYPHLSIALSVNHFK